MQVIAPAAAVPFLARGGHPRLVIDAEPVADSVDVIEVRDHLSCDGDRLVIEALAAEALNIGRDDASRDERQLDGVVAQGAVRFGQVRPAMVVDELLRERLVVGLPTEVPRMVNRSVIALVDVAHHGGEHLAAGGLQRVFGLHDADVQLHRGPY